MLCSSASVHQRRAYSDRLAADAADTEDDAEYAFEMASSNIRFGRGATKEVGQDLVGMGITDRVVVFTDAKLVNMPPALKVFDALARAGVQFEVYDRVQVEPTDRSLLDAIAFCRATPFKAFVAVGGGR